MSWLLIALFIFASSLYSGLETGGYLLNRIRLRVRIRHGSHSAHRLQRVLSDTHLFIFTVLIGQNISVYLVSREVTSLYLGSDSFVSGAKLLGFIPWSAETAATLTLMLPLFLLGEVFPKNLFRRHADTLMYRASIPLFYSWMFFYPITLALKKCFALLTGARGGGEGAGETFLSIQGFREYLLEEKARPVLSDHQHDMIEHLMSMDRVCVREIMRPVLSDLSISEEASLGDALEMMRSRGVDQLAVYGGSEKNISGYLSIFDLLGSDLDHAASVELHVTKAAQVSESQPLVQAYHLLRETPSDPLFVCNDSSETVGQLHLRDIAAYIASED